MTEPARSWKTMSRKRKLMVALCATVGILYALFTAWYAYNVYDSRRVHDAIQDGDIARMKQLLDEDPGRLNGRQQKGYKPLFGAYYGYTPLLEAARCGRTEAIDELVRRGADIHATHNDDIGAHGENALHIAADFGHVEATAALIRAGVDVNGLTDAGESPLDFANDHGHREIAELLRSAGGVGRVLP